METTPLPIPSDHRILFFERDREAFGFLSNYHEAVVTLDGELWRSTEFYYQAQKSNESEYRAAIKNAKNAGHAKGLGTDPSRSKKSRKRSWFNGRPEMMRADWHDVKLAIMEKAVRAKFGQNLDLGQMLEATDDAEIIEDSRYDSFWGIGPNDLGENWMGRILVKIRQELRDIILNGVPVTTNRAL